MTDTPSTDQTTTRQALIRVSNARQIVTGLAAAHPALADLWHQISDSLSDVPPLAAEITRLHTQLAATRLDRANLAAASRATIAAWRNDEHDPLSYVRDELTAQGFDGRHA